MYMTSDVVAKPVTAVAVAVAVGGKLAKKWVSADDP